MSELWDVAYKGNDVKLRELLVRAQKSDIEWKNSEWCDHTPLHIASFKGHISCVELLLDAGADANCRCSRERTPLHMSVYGDRTYNYTIVNALLAAGADPDLFDETGWTPLMVSILGSQSEVIKVILDVGADRELNNKKWGHPALILGDNMMSIIKDHERLEFVVRPEVVTWSGRSLPIELAELCGDFVVFTPKRRIAEARTILN